VHHRGSCCGRSGTEVVTLGVRSWMVGDAEPFKVDELVAENWSLVMDVIRGLRAPDTTVEGPMH